MQKTNLDSFYSSKKLGSFVENGKTIFRLFAPRAERVTLLTFIKAENSNGNKYKMIREDDGVWEATLEGELYGLFYGYLIKNSWNKDEIFCFDPYAKALVTLNNYLNPRKSIVVNENDYDWEDDEWIQRDWRDLIIYEMHVRDMTAHKSSGAKIPGTYKSLIDEKIKGGINYIKNLGVNAVELLPAQEFANIEIPFNQQFFNKRNTWNPYERNHWGYMTAGYFAPDSYYSDGGKELKWDEWTGKNANQVNEFKDMIKAFHKNGIAVIMDVVFNHFSEYEFGGLKEIDKEYYFRLGQNKKLVSKSYTGNDLKTERPMVRKMIVNSILFWMKYYHIDGFRFDMAKLIDWQTVEEITEEAKKINPDVILIAEPWGGGYDPAGFSLRGWGSWNDQIRNGIKGEDPVNGKGWLFKNWFGNNNYNRIRSYINGTLTKDLHGIFQVKEHSINYLESHDGYTLGDFIRIATGEVKIDEVIKNPNEVIKLTPIQLKYNKLAALFLFVSQGIVMIHAGQEFARSKVISSYNEVNDVNKGKLDHNSYEKDNETNYINYEHALVNSELVDFYKGLISLRKNYDVFSKSEYDDIKFIETPDNLFSVAFEIQYHNQDFIVIMNSDQSKVVHFELPEGEWGILVDENQAGVNLIEKINKEVKVNPISGKVLKKY